ncbi:hypothetical protein [Kiloniella litopenaei]|jgi:hypothetical protein|uniref:hypothetical protein n=1 Tax=Kiloniella litopenaei TaxID=1549748 RepID=UPI0012FF3B15|nr:hypothetical protein [Kiloniella litopenaei]
MPSVSKEIKLLNEAATALEQGQGWGLGFLKDLEKRSTHSEVKSLAAKVLEERGVRV